MLCKFSSLSPEVRSSRSRTVHFRSTKKLFKAMIWRRNRSGFCASSRISESESKTTRAGFLASTCSSTALVVSLSSTSEGWNIV